MKILRSEWLQDTGHFLFIFFYWALKRIMKTMDLNCNLHMASNVTVIMSPLLPNVQLCYQLLSGSRVGTQCTRRGKGQKEKYTASSPEFGGEACPGLTTLDREERELLQEPVPHWFQIRKENFWEQNTLLGLESSSSSSFMKREKGLRIGCFVNVKNKKSITYFYTK